MTLDEVLRMHEINVRCKNHYRVRDHEINVRCKNHYRVRDHCYHSDYLMKYTIVFFLVIMKGATRDW